ncbi:23S rRNA pseudouridine2605 synthase [Sedimentibacter acidaminivorans]|uniref:Pseudouridine synthase n=1 Tax=Sedimentibacter acidaminivorans TaxID=913099 RepID=A0ABS4GCL3_9FIRM|nr:pseudouridine synthase [Sedimentibacter acidaminivorans]MBP1925404.1 23S rRNA pseudouridine2605 synthase [Sedimentibacter acidaminivorans]
MKTERLQKYIASCGVTSRRKAEELIINGNVMVNNAVVTELGIKVDTENDVIKVNNKIIHKEKRNIYIKLYKPEGYVTTVKDQFGRKCVIDLVDIKERIYPIGRLDYDTSGLLLLTNDGDLANKLLHPKYHIYKTYIAEVEGLINLNSIENLKTGVIIDDYKTALAKVTLMSKAKTSSIVQISIHEGKNRQVRKMFESVGYPVIKLKRISFGMITLDSLNLGEWSFLSDKEINFLKNSEVRYE